MQNVFPNRQPSFQVQSDLQTVSLSTSPSAAPTFFTWPRSECSTEIMELTLISVLRLDSVIEIEYTIRDGEKGPSPSDP